MFPYLSILGESVEISPYLEDCLYLGNKGLAVGDELEVRLE